MRASESNQARMKLLIGIHNAWDIATYIAIERSEADGDGERED
jgi:hypothetical protein